MNRYRLIPSTWIPVAALLLTISPMIQKGLAEMPLARDGKALVKVVRPSNPTPTETRAVAELTNYLAKVTGVGFEVVEEKEIASDCSAVYIGATTYAFKQGIEVEKLGKEESIIRTVGNNLIIAGGRPRGTLYGVYIFLEDQLGVRWYTPWYEKVPQLASCSVKELNQQRKPFMESRDHYGLPWAPWQMEQFKKPYGGEGWSWWIARNRLNGCNMGRGVWYKTPYEESPVNQECGGGWIPGGFPSHNLHIDAAEYETLYRKHPEYFSMRNGKRAYDPDNRWFTSGNHLCLTNKEVRKWMKEKVLAMFRKIPSADFVSVAQNDGGYQTWCDCPECRAFVDQHGNEADLAMDFINPIAEAVEKEFPGKFIYTLGGYQPQVSPPKTIMPRENVIVMGAGWNKVAKHIWVWDSTYASTFVPFQYLRPLWWRVDAKFKEWKRLGISGVSAEDEVGSMDPVLGELYEMRTWMFAKLTENPDLNVDDLMKDFVNGYFGAAGQCIYDYLMLQKKRAPLWPSRMVNYEYVDQSQKLFDRAEATVAGNPELLARVKDLRINLDYTTLIYRQSAIGDYLRKGGKLENYPYKKDVLRDRLLKTLENTTHPYWHLPASWCLGKHRTESLRDLAVPLVRQLAEGQEYMPLPAEFKDIPSDRIVEYPLGLNNGSAQMMTADPEAALGVTWKYSWVKLPFETTVSRRDLSADILTIHSSEVRLIGRQDVKGPGYHVYKGGRFIMQKNITVSLCHTWESQAMASWDEACFPGLYDPAKLDEVWEWYVSLKFTGLEKGENPEGIFADRIILVDLGSAEVLKKAGQDVPLPTVRPVARWMFDGFMFDGTGDNRASDGELLKMPNIRMDMETLAEGRFGKALALKKPADTAVVPFDKRTMILNDRSFTISMWFRTDSADKGQVLFEQYMDDRHGVTLSVQDAKQLCFRIFDSESGKPTALSFGGEKVTPTDGKWHHVVAGYDKDNKRLFASMDGVDRQEIPFEKFPVIEAPIWIGGGTTGFLKGAVDEVQIYLNALPNLHGGVGKD